MLAIAFASWQKTAWQLLEVETEESGRCDWSNAPIFEPISQKLTLREKIWNVAEYALGLLFLVFFGIFSMSAALCAVFGLVMGFIPQDAAIMLMVSFLSSLGIGVIFSTVFDENF